MPESADPGDAACLQLHGCLHLWFRPSHLLCYLTINSIAILCLSHSRHCLLSISSHLLCRPDLWRRFILFVPFRANIHSWVCASNRIISAAWSLNTNSASPPLTGVPQDLRAVIAPGACKFPSRLHALSSQGRTTYLRFSTKMVPVLCHSQDRFQSPFFKKKIVVNVCL